MARTYQGHKRLAATWAALAAGRQPYREGELYNGVDVPGCPPFEDPTIPPAPEPTPPTNLRLTGNWVDLLTPVGASAASIDSADLLASELSRVAGGPPPDRVSWVGQAGIRVGLRNEWVAVGAAIPAWADWDWAIVTVGAQPYVLGRTARGLATAVRRVLHALGYRCLAPGAAWDVLPAVGGDVVFAAVHEGPSALRLRFLIGLGQGCGLGVIQGVPVQQTRLTAWEQRNGLSDDGVWDLGHAWGRIRNADPALFADHPEYLPGGAAQAGNKLCVYEPGVQAEALEWAQGRILTVADLSCVSMAAADGTVGWTAVCAGTGEQALHTPSDRQILLANYVQAALRTSGSDVRVGILAYGDMSAPPSTGVVLDADVVTIYASQYMVQGQTPEQVRDAYLAHGATDLATYGYPEVWTQDFDEPGRARATQRAELEVEAGRVLNAIGWTGEGGPSWAPHGRWYWSHAGSMFGDDVLARWDSWIAVAFPHAQAAATAYYAVQEQRVPLSTDLVHRLAQAALDLLDACAGYPLEVARALDLARYAAWVDLHRRYKAAPSATTLEPSMRWTYRCAIVDGTDGWSYRCPYATSPWSVDRKAIAATYGLSDLSSFVPVWPATPTGEAEVRAALATAVAQNPVLPFTPVGFTNDLVRPAGLTQTGPRGTYVYTIRPATWYLDAGGTTVFAIRGGIAFQNKGPDRVVVSEAASGEVVADWSIPEDGVSRNYTATTTAQRGYLVTVTPAGGVDVDWVSGTAMTIIPSQAVASFQASYNVKFYVPLGTATVGFYANGGTLRFFGADNVQIGSNIVASQDYYQVAVPEGHDGECWRLTGITGKLELMTVPPGVALAADELLIPREVLEADGWAPADAIPAPSRDYSVITFPTDLARPAGTLTGTGARGDYIYAKRPLVLWLSATGTTTTYTIKGGIASTTQGPDNVIVTDTVTSLVVANWSIPADKIARTYDLTGTVDGRLYRIDVTPAGGVDVDWAVGVRTTYRFDASGLFGPFIGSSSWWFYVPQGTVTIGFFADGGTVKFYDNTNHLVTSFAVAQDFHSFAVPAGQDRRCWRVTGPVGRIEIETVPRSVARAPGELLLPQSVIDADGI